MKSTKKNIFIAIIVVLITQVTQIWAQESKIELPDLTTIVTAEQTDIEDITVPDFADVVLPPENAGTLVLELPNVEVLEKSDVVVSDTAVSNKQVYAEGEVGGGFPAAFLGNFSVSRITGNEPFKIAFSHNSEAGYSGKSLSSGYFVRNTVVDLDKVFAWNTFSLDIAGLYENNSNGMQSQVPGVFAENQNLLSGKGKLSWNLPNDVVIGSTVNLDYYYRYADLSQDAICSDYIKHSGVVNINPSLFGYWADDIFAFGMNASVLMDADVQKSFQTGYQYFTRGTIDLSGEWKYKKMKAFGGLGIIFGDNLNSNKIIAPFNLGISTSFPVYYSDRNTLINVEGGLESYRNTNEKLEKTFNFSALDVIPSETSNWFIRSNVSFPLKTEFTGEVGIDFKKTAFGNGIWEPVYNSSNFETGLYRYSQTDKTVLSSDLAFTYRHNIFAGTLKWHANWKDTPVLENRHIFYLDLSFQNPDVKWGVDLTSGISIDGIDRIPMLNFEGFVGISPQAKLVLQAEDILKIFDPQPRTCAGKYITDSGNIKVLVKFLY